jgi:hypothetical protein
VFVADLIKVGLERLLFGEGGEGDFNTIEAILINTFLSGSNGKFI